MGGSCENEILIIDDRVQFCESLAENLEQLGYRGRYAVNRREAQRQFSGNRRIKAVLLDIVLGEEDGIDVLRELQSIDRRVPVIMLTGYASIQTAVRSIKLGAFDYLQKPVQIEALAKVIDNAVAGSAAEPAPGLVTRHPAMLELLDKARRIAAGELSILICGENGTGKELVADYIHAASPRRGRKMVKINCAAFPESLLDNELFGHEPGAYTGATSPFKGGLRAGQRRNAVPRRDRRHDAGHPGQDPAGPAEQRDPADRGGRDDPHRRALHRRHQPGPAGAHPGAEVPRGPVLPAERRHAPRPAAAGAQGGHPAPRRALPAGVRPRRRPPRSRR